jgi:molybdopterin-guanine dinucleotide biosynthesis protein A
MAGVSGVILAGGQSRRLGVDKATLRLGSRTLLERALSALQCVTDDIRIAGREDLQHLAPAVPIIADAAAGAGPLGGIVAALRAATYPCCLVVACDMPFLSVPLLRHLAELAPAADVVVPRTGAVTHQTHAVYSRSCLPLLEAQLSRGDYRVHALFPQVTVKYVDEEEIARFDPSRLSLININTREDLAAAERLLASRE